MTAPTVPDQATDLEEQLEREVPCDVNAIGELREDDAGHGPARWLLIAEPCATAAHVRDSWPICDLCAAWVRGYCDGSPGLCTRCGMSGPVNEFLTLKEL